jgi:precorrin-3B methylase
MKDEELSKKQEEVTTTQVEEVNSSDQVEAFLRYFELLHQINLKQKIVKLSTHDEVEDIRNTDTSSEAK